MIRALRAGPHKWRAGRNIAIVAAVAAAALPVMGAAGTPVSAQTGPGPRATRLFTHKQNVTGPGDSSLTSVSCPSASFCAAIDQGRAAVLYDGSAWSRPELIDPGAFLSSVSCPATTFCVAVNGKGDAVTYNGNTWSAPVTALAHAMFGAVSCATPRFCVATAADQVVTFNGSRWSAPVTVDGGNNITTLSCAAPSFCVGGDGRGNVVTFNGQRWSGPRAVTSAQINSVSCPTVKFCVAAGVSGIAVTYRNGTWSAPVTVDPTAPLSGVSCRSARFCVAVDVRGGATKYDGRAWSVPKATGTVYLTAVSCGTTHRCAAVGGAKAVMFHCGTWAKPVLADPVGRFSRSHAPRPRSAPRWTARAGP